MEFERLSEKVYTQTSEMISETESPFAVAGLYVMIAMQIYKTLMSDQEYNNMVDVISESRDRIKKLDNLIQTDRSKLN